MKFITSYSSRNFQAGLIKKPSWGSFPILASSLKGPVCELTQTILGEPIWSCSASNKKRTDKVCFRWVKNGKNGITSMRAYNEKMMPDCPCRIRRLTYKEYGGSVIVSSMQSGKFLCFLKEV